VATFYVTFGQRYRREPHPSGHLIHPDSYVKVEARGWREAEARVLEVFGQHYAFLYDEAGFKPELFPRGEAGVLSEGETVLPVKGGRE
jgi:hypothetical protein